MFNAFLKRIQLLQSVLIQESKSVDCKHVQNDDCKAEVDSQKKRKPLDSDQVLCSIERIGQGEEEVQADSNVKRYFPSKHHSQQAGLDQNHQAFGNHVALMGFFLEELSLEKPDLGAYMLFVTVTEEVDVLKVVLEVADLK